MNKAIHDLSISLLGGILVTLLDRLIIYSTKKFKGFRFRQIFGNDLADFNIVYGKMILNPVYASKDRLPYLKPNSDFRFSISSPVSFAETRAAKYLSESYSKSLDKSPRLVSDEEIMDRIDISYCSLGGYNNCKTIEILESIQNVYYELNLNSSASIINKNSPQNVYRVDGTYDYAVIIKIKHRLFPNRTQICVAGLGEWGTSGGAWFLANKWRELRKKAFDNNFGAVIKVRGGTDESAELVEIIQ